MKVSEREREKQFLQLSPVCKFFDTEIKFMCSHSHSAFFFVLAKSRYSCNKCPLLWQQIFSFSSPLRSSVFAVHKKKVSLVTSTSSYYFSIFLASPFHRTVQHPSNLLSILSEKQLFRDKKSHQGKNKIVEAARNSCFLGGLPCFHPSQPFPRRFSFEK